MKRCNVILMGLAAAVAMAGCAATHEQFKAEAQARWYSARSGVLMTAGEERFRVGDLDGAGASAREALALSPEMVSAHMLLARVAIEKGSYTEATEHLAEVGRLEPTDHRVPYLQAVVHERRGRYEQALHLYEKARALEPTNPAYVVAAAEVLVALGRADEALSLVDTKLLDMEESANVYMLAGDLAMLVNRPDRARDYFRQAQYMDPEDIQIAERLAKAHFYAGGYAEATVFLKDLLKHASYRDSLWVHTMLGNALLANNKPRLAKAAYERVTDLAGDQPQSWVHLATASLACNDLPRTVLSARRALRLDGRMSEATVLLSYALLAQGKSAEAQEVLAAAAKVHPNNSMIQCLLGRSYSAMGRTDQALAYYQATLQLDPDNLVAREMVAQLTQ